jgi:glycine/D-amino acid oxidase-like deaminating enzyme
MSEPADQPAMQTAAPRPDRDGHVDTHYLAHAGELPVFETFRGKAEAEVCVIGGGLAGLWTAHELARAGVSTILVEGERLAWGASGRNGGFVSPGFAESLFAVEEAVGLDHARALYRASLEGVGRVRALIRDNGRNDIVLGHGWLKLLRHADTAALERTAERMARDYGQVQEFLGRDDLARHVTSEAYHAGLLDPMPFHVQPLELAALLARKAAEAGVRIFEKTRARRVGATRKGFVVRANRGRIETGQVVLATSGLGGPAARMNAAILPVSTYMVSARSRSLDRAIRFGGCIADTRRAGDYYRVVGEGEARRLLWGGRITTRVGQPRRLAAMLRADILSVYPQLAADLEIERAWSGVMGYARHKMPIVGRLGRGLWMASALGGHGQNTAAMAGSMIARAISRGDDEWRLLEPFGAPRIGRLLGRLAAQLEYWRLQMLDRRDERR